MDKEKVTQFLDKLDIEYDLLQHPAAVTDEAIKYLDENLPSNPCKNLFLVNRQGTEFYLLMMPRNKDFRTKYIKEQLGLCIFLLLRRSIWLKSLMCTPAL